MSAQVKLIESALFAVVATVLVAPAFAQSSNRPAVLSAPGGRYVFGQVSEFRTDQFLLDTQTGRMWKFISYCTDPAKKETCGDPVLRPIEFTEVQPESIEHQVPAPLPSKSSGNQTPPDSRRK